MLKEEIESPKKDNVLFEIKDYTFYFEKTFYVLFGISGILIVSYFMDDPNQEKHRIALAFIGGAIVIFQSLIPILTSLFKNDKKILFYKDKIIKTQFDIEIPLKQISEFYISFLTNTAGEVVHRLNLLFAIILMSILGIWLLPILFLSYFVISLFNKKNSFFIKNLILIHSNGQSVISFPLNVLTAEEEQKVINFLNQNANIDLNNARKIFLRVPKIK